MLALNKELNQWVIFLFTRTCPLFILVSSELNFYEQIVNYFKLRYKQ